ncbi:MAG: DUF2878 family protein [Planctomycetaceae bacterium]|nr:DUF2878 family protein [Planctomycetaceae bacterium]
MAKLLNFVAFQVCWFACVLGAANGMGWLGAVAVAVFLAAHCALHRRGTGKADLVLALSLVGVGLVSDTLLSRFGWLSFDTGSKLWLVPLWMPALWANLGLTLRHSLSWLRGRYLLGAALGAISGPLSYWGGARLGALELHTDLVSSLVALALAWSLAMPLALFLEQRGAPASSPTRP